MADRPYNSPLLSELQALGVLFAAPPEGAVNMTGVTFDEAGDPAQIQNPAGELKDFPGGGGGGGGIPIPANNDGLDVVIDSGDGGTIQIRTVPDGDGVAGEINIFPGNSTAPGVPGSNLGLRAGAALDGDGGAVAVTGGTDFTTGATGAQITAAGANGGAGGGLSLLVGAGAAPGPLVLGSRSGDLAVAAGSNAVTVTAKGPAAGAVQISKWVPVTLDGVAGFLPFFTAV